MRLVVLAVVLLAGCAVDEGVTIERWQLGGESVTLPARLDVPDHAGTYELRATVTVPPAWRGRPLTLVVAELPAIVHARVDGAEIMLTEGPIVVSDYRSAGPLSWRIPAEASADGALAIVLVVEHRWTQDAWWGATPAIVAGDGRPAAAIGVLICNVFISLAAVISLLQLGLTALLVYAFDRKRRAYLWFAIQTLSAAYYPLFILGVTQVPFGRYDVPLLAMSLVTALVTSIHFTREFFELPAPSRWWWSLWLLMLAVLIVFHDPFNTTRYGGPVTVAILLGCSTYQLFTCGRLALTHPDRLTARLQFAAWIALASMQPPDLLHWLGGPDLLHGARVASLGLLMFATCLSLLLGRRHIMSLRLEAEHLARSRAEVEQLNVELRRQVAERSAQLFAALAIAGGRNARAPELTAGELVHARYKIVRELGRGGMGTVYEVERVSDGRRLALKLTHELTGTALARLAREALIASQISHPNLVGVIDVDVAASGFLYVVMELVEGTSLKAARDRYADPARALPLLAQIADGLAALHRAGVVHRDLKPANILLAAGDRVKITDFGVSRRMAGAQGWPEDSASTDSHQGPFESPFDDDASADQTSRPAGLGPARPRLASQDVGDATIDTAAIPSSPTPSSSASRSPDPNLTRTGFLVGTPAYIAPELVDGPETLSPAADLFAFGVIAFELITGDRPFVKPAAISRMHGKEPDPPPPVAWRWPNAIPEVAAMIDRCLLGDPARRPTADEVSAVLLQWRA